MKRGIGKEAGEKRALEGYETETLPKVLCFVGACLCRWQNGMVWWYILSMYSFSLVDPLALSPQTVEVFRLIL